MYRLTWEERQRARAPDGLAMVQCSLSTLSSVSDV